MNPYDAEKSEPNFWLSCILIDEEAMCRQTRSEREALYISEPGKSCPTEILDTLMKYNAEGRPIWKPMHMQPVFQRHKYVTMEDGVDVGADIFARGLCLPSDIKMTADIQNDVIEIIKECFEG